jgi:outer membrane usher protein FimD/PapC
MRVRSGILQMIVAATLGACASAPPREQKVVDVSTGTLTPEYSSINTRVLTEAASVNHAFVASLDPHKEPLTRLESNFTQSLGASSEQLRVGDTVSSVGMWGTSVRYGGMQFGTRSDVRADVIDSSELASSGLAVLPTVADALFASAGDPGTSLAGQNLSVARSLGRGSAAWSLTAEDAQGRSESIDAPMIASTALAQRGCSDFSVGLGKVRRDYALISNEYGPLFANTTVTCGAPLGLTVEGHGEYLDNEVAALGVGVARQVGPIGTASVAFASSHAEAGSGWLARVGFEHTNSMFNVMLRSRIQSRDFREVGTTLLNDPVMQRDLASIGVNVTEGSSLSLAYAAQTTWTRERTNLVAIKQSVNVGRGSLSMSAGHSLEDNFGTSLFLSYKRPFGFTRPTQSSSEEFDLQLLDSALAQ